MSKLNNTAGHLETVTLTYPTPTESYNASGTLVPMTEPATGQVIYTMQNSDVPKFSDARARCTWIMVLVLGGKNNTAATRTLSMRILKNGVSVATPTQTMSTNYYWTGTYYLFDVKEGDTIEVRFWCTTDAVSLDLRYNTFFLRPTRFRFGELDELLLDFVCPSYSLVALTGGLLPYYSITVESAYMYHIPSTGTSTSSDLVSLSSTDSFPVAMHHPTYGIGFVQYGDRSTTGETNTSATRMPYYPKLQNRMAFRFRRMRL